LKATCNCGRVLTPIKNGVDVLINSDWGNGPVPYQIYRADVWGCTRCKTQIAIMNDSPYTTRGDSIFKEELGKVVNKGYLWIQKP
jgi:hypothetical protein